MKQRLTALTLAGLMLLGLSACGGKDVEDTSPAPSDLTFTAPVESEAPTQSQTPESSAPVDSEAPTPSEPVTSLPTQTAPASGEAPAPSENAEPLTASDIYILWTDSSSQHPAPGSDFTDMSAYLENFYNLSADDLESFVFYQPDMSSTLQEVFLAKAKPGKASDVKAACQGRLEALQEEAQFYTGTGNYVDSAVLESVDDWVALAACPDNARLVKVLRDATK